MTFRELNLRIFEFPWGWGYDLYFVMLLAPAFLMQPRPIDLLIAAWWWYAWRVNTEFHKENR